MIATISSTLLILFLNLFITPSALFAQEQPKKIGELFSMFENIFSKILPIAGLLCVVFIIQGGYMWMTSSGDPSKIKQAQGTLTWAVIGLVFVILSASILSAIIKIFD